MVVCELVDEASGELEFAGWEDIGRRILAKSSGRGVGCRRFEVGIVECVEGFGPELQLELLREAEGLMETGVEVVI